MRRNQKLELRESGNSPEDKHQSGSTDQSAGHVFHDFLLFDSISNGDIIPDG
jgi:hypothetical protein